MSLRFFHRLGATLLNRSPLCGGIRGEAYAGTFGECPGTPLQQVSLAKLIIVWGNNATACNLHLMRHINAAKRNGAKLVVIDPTARQGRRAGAPASARSAPAPTWCWPGRSPSNWSGMGGLDHAFIEKHVLGFEAYMAARARVPAGARGGNLRRAVPRISARWRAGTTRRRPPSSPGATAWSATRTAAPACARSPRSRRWPASSAWRAAGWSAARATPFRQTPDRLTRPDLVPPGTRTINILDVAHAAARSDSSTRRSRRCSSTTTIR